MTVRNTQPCKEQGKDISSRGNSKCKVPEEGKSPERSRAGKRKVRALLGNEWGIIAGAIGGACGV